METYITSIVDPDLHLSAHSSGRVHFRKRVHGGRIEVDRRLNERAALEHPKEMASRLWKRSPRRPVYWVDLPAGADGSSATDTRIHVDLDQFASALSPARKMGARRAIQMMGALRPDRAVVALEQSFKCGLLVVMDGDSWVVIPAGREVPPALASSGWWKEVIHPTLTAHKLSGNWSILWSTWLTHGGMSESEYRKRLKQIRRLRHHFRGKLGL